MKILFIFIFSCVSSIVFYQNKEINTSSLPHLFFEPATVFVQGGTFQMGDILKDATFNQDEIPIHNVTLDSFYMGKYEVSQIEWTTVMGSNPSYFKGDSLPVESVSWGDIQEYLKKLNQKTGKKYRLPTEAEWEYAAREGGKNIRFGNGKNRANPSEINFDAVASNEYTNSDTGVYREKTVATNSFLPNNLGLFNMSGNVSEWCNDWHEPYSSIAQQNPKGAERGTSRIHRGGSWLNSPFFIRTACRISHSPNYRHSSLGFRVVLSN